MKDTNGPSEDEFSVRDQFAGTDPAKPLSVRPAAPAQAGETAPRPGGSRIPLRRPVTPETAIQLIDWPQLARGLRRRLWIVVLLAAVAAALGLVGRIRMGRPQYEARASLLYRVDRQKQVLSSAGNTVTIKGLSRGTALSLLRRGTNLKKVVEQVSVDMSPAELGWRVQTKSDKQSEIVLLRVGFMPSREMAIAAANEVARVGIEDNRDFYRNQAVQMAEQFKRQADAASAKANAAREALTAFQTQRQLLEVDAETKAFLDSMVAVSERLHAARIARDAQTVRIANYQRMIKEMPDEVVRESFEDNPLKRRISNAEVALMDARTRYGPQNPRVLQMEDSIREMRRTMAEPAYNESREKVYVPNPDKQELRMEVLRLEAEQEVFNRSVEQVERQEADLKAKYAYLPQQQIELAGFHERHTAAEALCRSLERSAADAMATADLDMCDFELLESAHTAAMSRGKLASVLPILALIFGTIAGTVLCLVLELTDPRLKSAGQIERLYTIPCLGTVSASSDSAIPAAFLPVCRSLYQRMTMLPAPEGARVLSVLSALPGDGKSTFAFQAARYWAALGVKTACVDFDPGPNPWLSQAGSRSGIEEYLAGKAAWDDVVFSQEDVACFKLRQDSGDLPERMHGSAMRRFMDTLRSRYGCVIVESPAWVSDEVSARMLAGMTDHSLWVASVSLSTRPVVGKAFDALDRAGIHPLGMILNRASSEGGGRL